MRLLTCCLLCALALSASAEVYKYTDAQGKTVFTNQPPEGQPVERIELPPTNTIQSSFPEGASTPPAASSLVSRYRVLQLVGLPDDEALRANNGTFTVSVQIEPPLAPGHSLQLLLDGSPHGPASTTTQLQINQTDRGTHSLAVQVLANGKALQQSDVLTFTVQRISINSPARKAAP